MIEMLDRPVTSADMPLPREQMRARYPDIEGHVERDGIRVFYEVYGTGEQTVLLMPTWEIIHSRMWRAQIPYLARHCRVVCLGDRGDIGRSVDYLPVATDGAARAATLIAGLL